MTDTVAVSGLSQAAAAGAPGGWQRLKRDRMAMVALWFLALMVLACFLGPPLMDDWRNRPSEAVFGNPGGRNIFGTDSNGRDLFYRVLSGGRVSLVVGLCAAAVSLVIGTAVGMTAGFFGGKVDAFIMRMVDVLYSMPRVLFALVLIAAMDEPIQSLLGGWLTAADQAGNTSLKQALESILPYSRTLVLILCLGMLEWLTMARIVRGQVLVLKEQQFVAAARCLGQTRWRIMSRHLLPNLWTVILTYLTLTIPIVVLDESFLSFLGLGIEEPAASWGLLLGEGAASINLVEPRWWLPVFPAAAMTVTLLALNFLGDSLRDALDVH
jgi:peptide/nickel transport system permease protein/oligopeptide transport system permease protein